MNNATTVGRFIIEKQGDINIAAKIANREVNQVGLINILGSAGHMSIQTENQRKLDIYSNEKFISNLSSGGECCVTASEENEDIMRIDSAVSKGARYIVAIAPLNGSSNIDDQMPVNTIFSIYQRRSAEVNGDLSDVLQKGKDQIATGYITYGSLTMLTYTNGCGFNGEAFDTSIGEFCLSRPNIKISKNGITSSINEGSSIHFPQGVKQYIKYCQVEVAAMNRPYNSGYIGSMVAYLNRKLIKGGILIYPATATSPNSELLLIYECNPLAFVIEQAGGGSTNGSRHILELEVKTLPQRFPIIIGSEEMLLQAEAFLTQQSETAYANLE